MRKNTWTYKNYTIIPGKPEAYFTVVGEGDDRKVLYGDNKEHMRSIIDTYERTIARGKAEGEKNRLARVNKVEEEKKPCIFTLTALMMGIGAKR